MKYSFITILTHPETEQDFSADVTVTETLMVDSIWNMDEQSDVTVTAEFIEQVCNRLEEHRESEAHAHEYARGENAYRAKMRGW